MECPNNDLTIKKDLEYELIGSGGEGEVYKYNDQLAFKTFLFFSYPEKLALKLKKIELLMHLRDSNACLPKGFVRYEDGTIKGYYCDLVNPHEAFKDLDAKELLHLKDIRKKLKLIIEADEAIQRFHKMGIILGDIKGNNIMIDTNENIRFVDTDNWMYGGYGFDIDPIRASWLKRIYKKEFSGLDNDRFIFSIMSIQILLSMHFIDLRYINDKFLENMIYHLEVPKEIKEYLRLIFSDAKDKPYIGDILRKIETEELISEVNRELLRYRRIR